MRQLPLTQAPAGPNRGGEARVDAPQGVDGLEASRCRALRYAVSTGKINNLCAVVVWLYRRYMVPCSVSVVVVKWLCCGHIVDLS